MGMTKHSRKPRSLGVVADEVPSTDNLSVIPAAVGSTTNWDLRGGAQKDLFDSALRRGPKWLGLNHTLDKLRTTSTPDDFFIFVCRCPLCRTKGICQAEVFCLDRKQYREYIEGETLDPQSHVVLDRHGFISYHHPLPEDVNATSRKWKWKQHLKQNVPGFKFPLSACNSLGCDDDHDDLDCDISIRKKSSSTTTKKSKRDSPRANRQQQEDQTTASSSSLKEAQQRTKSAKNNNAYTRRQAADQEAQTHLGQQQDLQGIEMGVSKLCEQHDKLLQTDPENFFIFVCRCPFCQKRGILKAKIIRFDKKRCHQRKEGDKLDPKCHVVLDQHGFVSYHHPFPLGSMFSQRRNHLKTHLKRNGPGFKLPLSASTNTPPDNKTDVVDTPKQDEDYDGRSTAGSEAPTAKKRKRTHRTLEEASTMDYDGCKKRTRILKNMRLIRDELKNASDDDFRRVLQLNLEKEQDALASLVAA